MYSRDNISGYRLIDDGIRELIEAFPDEFTPDEVQSIADSRNEIRFCSVCGRPMIEGYYAEGEGSYYCSEECMERKGISKRDYLLCYYGIYDEPLAEAVSYMPEEDFMKLCEKYGNEDGSFFYWTEWVCDKGLFDKVSGLWKLQHEPQDRSPETR